VLNHAAASRRKTLIPERRQEATAGVRPAQDDDRQAEDSQQ
jgi:hypothetical protein